MRGPETIEQMVPTRTPAGGSATPQHHVRVIGFPEPGDRPIEDRRYRWVVVAYTLLLQAVCIGALIYCFALFSVQWLDEFSAARGEVMLTIALLQIGMGVFSPFVGRAMDSYPLRNLVLLGAAAFATGFALCAQASALWQIQLVYATFFPAATALMGTLAAQTLVAKWFSEQRGLAIGVSATGTNIGGIILPLAVAAGLASVGWRNTMLAVAAASLVLIVPTTWLVLRRSPPQRDASGPVVAASEQRLWSTREILSTRNFWIPVVGIVPLNLTFGALQFNLGAYGRDLGLSEGGIATLIALNAVCMVLGKFFCGALGDRISHRRLYWIVTSAMALALGILQADPGLWLFVAALVFLGFSGGGILPMMGVMLGSRFGAASFGRVIGIAMLAITVGALGPLLAGWAHDLTGSYAIAFQVLLVLMVPPVIAMAWLPDSVSATPAGGSLEGAVSESRS